PGESQAIVPGSGSDMRSDRRSGEGLTMPLSRFGSSVDESASPEGDVVEVAHATAYELGATVRDGQRPGPELLAGGAGNRGCGGQGGRRFWLVRHGESVWNRAGLIQGQAPAAPGLTPRGREQAAAAAAALASSGAELVIASGLCRAFETATIIAERLALPVVVDDRLQERSLGAAEGQPEADFREPVLGLLQGSVFDPDRAPNGAESIRELCGRVGGFLQELAGRTAPPAVLVTHGDVIAAALALVAGESFEEMRWREVANASLFEFRQSTTGDLSWMIFH
ncbi:MAG: Phosphoglycerate mutase, partial [Chloroflexi bacterium]|nr:Phosphoglycerate mutase [Chloroflexota bacterium]